MKVNGERQARRALVKGLERCEKRRGKEEGKSLLGLPSSFPFRMISSRIP